MMTSEKLISKLKEICCSCYAQKSDPNATYHNINKVCIINLSTF